MALTSILPNQYLRSSKEYVLPLPLDIPMSLFINSAPLDYADFNNLELAAVDGTGAIILTNVAPVQRVFEVDTPSEYKIYLEDITVSGITPFKEIYFIVYDTISQEVIFKSNCFQIRPQDHADNLARVSYRNSTNIYGYNFEGLPDFYQSLFIDLNAASEEVESKDDTYTEVTTGYERPTEIEQKHIVNFIASRFDIRAHKAMFALSACDDIEINFRKYQRASTYTYKPNNQLSLHNGEISFYDQENNMTNLNGEQSVI